MWDSMATRQETGRGRVRQVTSACAETPKGSTLHRNKLYYVAMIIALGLDVELGSSKDRR